MHLSPMIHILYTDPLRAKSKHWDIVIHVHLTHCHVIFYLVFNVNTRLELEVSASTSIANYPQIELYCF